jgi:hypothetical protein
MPFGMKRGRSLGGIARREWEGCGDGAQADDGERPNHAFSHWEISGSVGVTREP